MALPVSQTDASVLLVLNAIQDRGQIRGGWINQNSRTKRMSDWSIFPNGTSFMVWRDRNCDQCVKDYCESKHADGTNPNCEIEQAISLASGGNHMSRTFNTGLPMAECPHCGKAFQWDDYYDLETGDSRECPKCEKEIHVLRVDHVIHVTLGVQPL